MSTEPGALVAGRYRLQGIVGVGAVGTVWSARDEESGEDVAVKLLAGAKREDPIALQRFLLEAEAAFALRHRSIVEVRASGRVEGGPYIVMERLRGRTLGDVLATTRLAPADAVEIVRCVAEGLAIAHAAGIVHRDIKPANVFLHRAGGEVIPKLLDFGIFKFLDPAQDGGLSMTGDVLGSPTYMSPEQIRTPRDVDHRLDLWALGMVLYRATTGGFPFDARDQGKMLVEIASKDLALSLDDAPPAVAAIVRRCLRRARDERYASATELADDCVAALVELGVEPDLRALV